MCDGRRRTAEREARRKDMVAFFSSCTLMIFMLFALAMAGCFSKTYLYVERCTGKCENPGLGRLCLLDEFGMIRAFLWLGELWAGAIGHRLRPLAGWFLGVVRSGPRTGDQPRLSELRPPARLRWRISLTEDAALSI